MSITIVSNNFVIISLISIIASCHRVLARQ